MKTSPLNWISCALAIAAAAYAANVENDLHETIRAHNALVAAHDTMLQNHDELFAWSKAELSEQASQIQRNSGLLAMLQDRAVQVDPYTISIGESGHTTCLKVGLTCGFVMATDTVDPQTGKFIGWHVASCDSKLLRKNGETILQGKYVQSRDHTKERYRDDLDLTERDLPKVMCLVNPKDDVERHDPRLD